MMKETLRKAYRLLPLKKEIFSFIKLFWRPSDRVYRHLHFADVFNVKIDSSHSFRMRHYGFQLENELFWRGIENGWEKVSITLWLQLCKKSAVIVDIGANTGVYALAAKAVNPNAQVYAFEPVHRVFEKLESNIRLNGFDIVAIEKAVSDYDGYATLYDQPTEHIYSVTVNKNLADPDTKVIETTVATVMLDTFIKSNGISRIDLLKIDVETHEPEVLKGFSQYIKSFKPAILVEVLNESVGKQIELITAECGYLYFNIDEDSGIRKVDNISVSDYYNYLLVDPTLAVELKLV